MNLWSAVKATLRSKRFWVWQLAGVVIYGLPVVIRFATGSVAIPILNFPGFWIGHFIPGNMLEKVLVTRFFLEALVALLGKCLLTITRAKLFRGRLSIYRDLVALCCRQGFGLRFSYGVSL